MTDHCTYYNYLLRRTFTGLIYRQYVLYPRLNRELNGSVLDIGCGIGDFLAFRKGSVGVDVNSKLVAHCRHRGLDARVMDVNVLPFENATFDSAVLDNVLEHLVEPDLLLAEAHRVLRPQGTLVVGVPGERGYRDDSDHKVYYDEDLLTETLSKNAFSLRKSFYMPIRSSVLAKFMPQYCLYAAFDRR